MSELMQALKNAVNGSKSFVLFKKEASALEGILSVCGSITDINIKIPVSYSASNLHWESNETTAVLLISAIASLPDEADPCFLIDDKDWEGGSLMLHGTWMQKGRGRAKETPQYRRYLIDVDIRTVDV